MGTVTADNPKDFSFDCEIIFLFNTIYIVCIYVKVIVDSKNMTRSKLSKLANVWFEVTDKWYNGNIDRMVIDVFTRICFVLDWEISDLVTFDK